MSVLLKGMKMPKSCIECPLETDYVTCGYYAPTKDNECNYQKRPVFCPLIEVPKHGRLIDADALLNLLNCCMFPSDMVTTTAVSMATNWIKDAPTVIEAEAGE